MDLNHPSEIIKVLDNVIQLIENPDNWLKGCMAQTAHGSAVAASDRRAKRFCIEGAITHTLAGLAATDGSMVSSVRVSGILRKALGTRLTLTAYNDNCQMTHEQLISNLRRAVGVLKLQWNGGV